MILLVTTLNLVVSIIPAHLIVTIKGGDFVSRCFPTVFKMFYTITKSLQKDLKINQTKYFNTVGSV